MSAASAGDVLPAAQRPRRHKAARTVSALVLREMATTYGRSPGGYLWAVLEPVAAVALLSFVFSLALRSPALGDNFPLFYATGYLPFSLFLAVQVRVSQSIRFSRPLLAYPAVTFVDAIAARFALTMITQLMVSSLVLSGIVLIYDLRVSIDLPTLMTAYGLAALLGLGIGSLNCFIEAYVPIWTNVWAILTRPLLLVSGVLFVYEAMPQNFRDIVFWNPLFHVTGLAREGFYVTYDANYVSVPFVASVGAVTLFFGLLLLGRWHRDILARR